MGARHGGGLRRRADATAKAYVGQLRALARGRLPVEPSGAVPDLAREDMPPLNLRHSGDVEVRRDGGSGSLTPLHFEGFFDAGRECMFGEWLREPDERHGSGLPELSISGGDNDGHGGI